MGSSRGECQVRRSASPHLGSAFQQHAGPNSQMPPLSADDFLRPWTPTSLERLALAFTPEDLEKYVNLRPYINEAALVTLRTTSLRRVSRLFLTMGLRHLLVVESCPKVVGVITRKDIIYGGDERAPRPTDRLVSQAERRAEGRFMRKLRAWGSRARARSGSGGTRTSASDGRGSSYIGGSSNGAVLSNGSSSQGDGTVRASTSQLRQPMLGGSDARGGEQTPDVM